MIVDDSRGYTYAHAMAAEPAHIVLNIDTSLPIEVGDFVSAFASLASQYERFIKEKYPEFNGDAQIYVREIRPGSIEADLIPWLFIGAGTAIGCMDQLIIVDQFIRLYGSKVSAYFLQNGRSEGASRTDLKDFMGTVRAIANDPDASATIESAFFEDGERKVKSAFRFTTPQARQARDEIEQHKRELDRPGNAPHERVLMVFRQCNVRDVVLGKRSGETVMIEDIYPHELPLIYSSELAEQRIKHEIREAEDNVFKKGFVVDVSVQLQSGKPVAYRITNTHQVIDLPDAQ